MGKYRLKMYEERCINCKACENICRETHDTAPGLWLGKLIYEEVEGQDKPYIRFKACPQCNNAKCVRVCPTGALVRRESDGTVYIEPNECIGCRLCEDACPHDLIWMDPRTRKVVKCDFCYERLDKGLQPACVASCPTNALELVERTPGDSPHGHHKNTLLGSIT